MDTQFLQIFFGVIYTSTLFIIGYILWKKRIIRFRFGSYVGFVNSHNNRSCRARYKLFSGFEYFYFRFQKGATVTLKYSVKVEKGTLTINLRNKSGEIYTKTFEEDGEGEHEFMTESKWHSIQFDGQKTKGSFSAELIVK